MPGPVRESQNAKARRSATGSRKKGKVGKHKNESQEDSNASILAPENKTEKETARKIQLLKEITAQSETKWTSKKKKRLEKYIDKKLKKEERVMIFERLAQTQASLPSSVLHSSASLGTGKLSTHQELQEKAEDRDTRKALAGLSGKRKRHQDHFHVQTPDEDDDISKVEDHSERFEKEQLSQTIGTLAKHNANVVVPPTDPSRSQVETHTLSVAGSALQRNPDGSAVAPKIRVKSEKQSKRRGWGRQPITVEQDKSEASFDSSDSEYDSMDAEMTDADEPSVAESEIQEEPTSSYVNQLSAPIKKKALGFKEWAIKQLSTVKGYQHRQSPEPPEPSQLDKDLPARKKRKTDSSSSMRGPLGKDLRLPTTSFAKHVLDTQSFPNALIKVVEVKRPPEVVESRILLPIITEEQPIMEAILLNPVIIICGETGSGKTTQVPQFLYEAGFGTSGSENPGMIGITQPRRVAAMSMAARVAHELSLTSSRVSYQIRYDATVSPSTSIKFMTDGVLLRELATDFLLAKYSVIIIDEAHERSMNTDILIGILSRVIKLREEMWKEGKENVKPLRLIIMSATLRVSDFAENKTLFTTPPPVITVAARQHPVTIHFSRRTRPDYVTEAIKKALKIHTRLAPGGILIFLTGQTEITGVCRTLEAKFGRKAIEEKKRRRGQVQQGWDGFVDKDEVHTIDSKTMTLARADLEAEDIDLGNTVKDDLALDVDGDLGEVGDLEALDSDNEGQLDEELGLDDNSEAPMHIVPLYSLLPSEKQLLVFQPPPAGSRLVVVSTNIAETSLTIPGIQYVVDCGRAKERRYDIATGIQNFQVAWISKASAAQRAGRAGRTGPGHCYRLYSSALFEHHFEKFATPEIQQMPIDGVVLQMKSMHIDAVVNFPFPTPPDRSVLLKAEKTLIHLGALRVSSSMSTPPGLMEGQISELGRAMALFPLSPRFSRMLVSGQQHGCLPYVICVVSAMSVGDPFIYEEAIDNNSSKNSEGLGDVKGEAVKAKEERALLRKAFFQCHLMHASLGKYTSDVLKTLSVISAYENAGGGQKFCSEHFVRPKAMEEIHKLRAQINNIVRVNFPGTDPGFSPLLPPPNERQLKVLKQLLTAGFIDQVAVRKDLIDKRHSTGTQRTSSRGVAYKALGVSDDVYIHPSSLLVNAAPPDYLIFQDLVQTSRTYVKGLTIINPAWLSTLGKDVLCTFSKPVKNNAGEFMTIPRFGPDAWELPAIKAGTDIGI